MELDNCIAPEVIDTDLESSFHFNLLILLFRKLFLHRALESGYMESSTKLTFLGYLRDHIGCESGFR